jgi:dimeric dUTPase (all-alpha-NTP-PPase superfamily)
MATYTINQHTYKTNPVINQFRALFVAVACMAIAVEALLFIAVVF